jgi:uncharacterized protein with PIN domain
VTGGRRPAAARPARGGYPVVVLVDPALSLFLGSRQRAAPAGPGVACRVEAGYDGTSSLGHLVESLGVPLPEVGELRIGPRRAAAADRVPPGQPVTVTAVARPQPLPPGPPRFVLDVHLGTLARRMRLLGLDTRYANAASDDALLQIAAAENRVLLTQDRGLLRRRALRLGAYVRGAHPDQQLHDVLDRFAPPLAPWTRCPACNGLLVPVTKDQVRHLLQPGTQRSYQVFARCPSCGRPYWRGAHSPRLAAVVAAARQAVAARQAAPARAQPSEHPCVLRHPPGSAQPPAPRPAPGRV